MRDWAEASSAFLRCDVASRFALKPVVDAFGRFMATKGTEETIAIVERRMLLLEEQVEAMKGSVDRLLEVAEFEAQLKSGKTAPELTAGTPEGSSGTD